MFKQDKTIPLQRSAFKVSNMLHDFIQIYKYL